MKLHRERASGHAKLRLGPGGVVYVLVTALILGAAVYTQANLLFWGFGLLIGGLVVSILLAWQTLRSVQVQRLLPGHGVCGEALPLRYHIRNRSWLPVFAMTIHETWGRGGRGWKHAGPIAEAPQRLRGRPHGWVLHLGPHQAIQAEAPCWPMRRGPLAFERIVLSTSFPFGIIRKVVEIPAPGEVLVYPHLYRMNRRILYALSSLDPSGRKQVDRGGGTEEFFGIRPYRYGDSMKLIDWKHTARTGQPVAREFTQPSPPRVMILLDLRADAAPPAPPNGSHPAGNGHANGNARRLFAGVNGSRLIESGLSIEERAISLTASLVCDAHFHGYQVGLTVAGVRSISFPLHHSLPHRTKMLEALAGLDLSARGNAGPTTTMERPNVVVWPGPGESYPPGGVRGTAVLGAADLDLYVDLASVTPDLLRRQTRATSRRDDLAEMRAQRGEGSEAGTGSGTERVRS